VEEQLRKPEARDKARIVAAHYPMRWDASWENRRFPRWFFQLTGPRAIRLNLIMAENLVAAYLAGHTHGHYEVQDELTGIRFIITGAVQHGSYRICCVDGGVFSSTPTEAGEWPKVVVLRPKARLDGGSSFVGDKVTVRACLFSPEPVERVDLLCDGAAPQRMQPAEGEEGVWQTTWDTNDLVNGRHEITVRAVSGEHTGEATIAVAVSNIEE